MKHPSFYRNTKFLLISLFLVFCLSSCRVYFLPKKQSLTFKTENDSTEIYVNKEYIGEGKATTKKIPKSGVKEITLRTLEHKDVNTVIYPEKVNSLYIPLFILDLASFLGLWFSPGGEYGLDYEDEYRFSVTSAKYPDKKESEKNIQLIGTGITINDINENIVEYDVKVKVSQTLQSAIQKAIEDKKREKESDKKERKIKLLDEEDKEIKYDDSYFSIDIYETLRNSGYIDTTETLFRSKFNTIGLKANIKKIEVFNIKKKVKLFRGYYNNFLKIRMDIDWLLKNAYGETIDSLNTSEYSGEFKAKYYDLEPDDFKKWFGDCVNNSFLSLFSNDTFLEHLKKEEIKPIKASLLTLRMPKKTVGGIETAIQSSVIVKHKEDKGFGSGFAITEDGYILTNYHVIASEVKDVHHKLQVVLPTGEKLDAKVVRANKNYDVALLKVDKTFETPFMVKNTKDFKPYEDVYTVGTPKSVDLGQTVTKGLPSSEREGGDYPVIQLSMAINSGNSGGPLFGKEGSLYGIVSSKLVGIGTEGIGFAIPAYKLGEYLNIEFK